MNEQKKTIEIRTHIPNRLRELWDWFEAVYEWDWGDPDLLAALIHTEQIPPEFQIAVAEIVAEVRPRPNYGKSVLSAQHRLFMAKESIDLAEFRDNILSDNETIEKISDEEGKEPIEVIRDLQNAFRIEIESRAKANGASVDTMKNIRRDFKSRIDRWPTV